MVLRQAARRASWLDPWAKTHGGWGPPGWTDWPAFARSAGGKAFPDGPAAYILLANGNWLDISTDVRFTTAITVTTGRNAGDTRVRAGNVTLRINNIDGKYSPRNVLSPLFGQIGRNTQLRVSRRGALRFWGEVPEWPSQWTTGGLDAWVDVPVGGPLRHLLAGNAPLLQSALTRSQYAAAPASGWTLEEASSALYAASVTTTGLPATTFGGATFGGVTDLGGSAASPNTGSAGNGLAARVNFISGPWGVEFAAKSVESANNAMFYVTDTNGNSFSLLTPFNLPANQLSILINNFGGLALSATTVPWTVDADFNNAWHYYAIYISQLVAGTLSINMWVDGVLAMSSTASTYTLGSPKDWQAPADITGPKTVGPDGSLKSISHLSFFSGTTPSAIYRALTGYAGETAGRRIQRLCAENNVGFVGVGDLDDTMAMGAQGVDKLIDLLYDCEDADMGFLSETRDAFGLGYRTRSSMYNRTPVLALSYTADGNVDGQLVPTDNDVRVINDSNVQRKGGSSARYVLTTGPMSTASVANGGIGTYPENPTINLASDSNALEVAGWHVNVGTVDEQRFDNISVNIGNTITNHNLISLADQMCAVDTGDLITIGSPPVWINTDLISALRVGSTEKFDQLNYTIAYNTIPSSPFVVGVWDTSRWSDDGTTVQTGIDTVTTAFQGLIPTTSPGSSLWITVAYLATIGETWVNFDVMASTGERLTVTDITGVNNPQTWTVIRSVNGVVAPLPAGTIITLRNPFRWAV